MNDAELRDLIIQIHTLQLESEKRLEKIETRILNGYFSTEKQCLERRTEISKDIIRQESVITEANKKLNKLFVKVAALSATVTLILSAGAFLIKRIL